jgi:transposase InsO family protein
MTARRPRAASPLQIEGGPTLRRDRSAAATLRRAAAWMREQGCGPAQAVMSDNAKCYATSFEFRDTLAELGARHILIPPRTPRWNGKIERFFGTLDREWAHGRVWPNSTQRRPGILHPLLQPPPTTLSLRRPTAHHPRSPTPRAAQLERSQRRILDSRKQDLLLAVTVLALHSDEASRSARQHGSGCRTDGLACNAWPMMVSLRRRTGGSCCGAICAMKRPRLRQRSSRRCMALGDEFSRRPPSHTL